MFSFNHYVPVARFRSAELAALRSVASEDCEWATPLLEWDGRYFTKEKDQGAFDRRMADAVGHLNGWAGRRIFVDFGVRPSRVSALKAFGLSSTRIGITPVPVVSLKMSQTGSYAAEVDWLSQTQGSGLCLRVSPAELSLAGAERLILSCLSRFGLRPSSVDLIVDRGEVGSGSESYESFVTAIPERDDAYWQRRRTNVAFPPYWFLTSAEGRRVLDRRIGAARSIGVHVPADVPSQSDRRAPELRGHDLFTVPDEVREIR